MLNHSAQFYYYYYGYLESPLEDTGCRACA